METKRMEVAKEEPPPSSRPKRKQVSIELVKVVKQLHGLHADELSKIMKDSENFTIPCQTDKGSTVNIDAEKLANFLPVHLIARLVMSERDDELFDYLLRGFRLLLTLCEIATRHYKLEQILLDDVKLSEQMIDLAFYSLLVLANFGQGYRVSTSMILMHSTLVPCSLHLLTACISQNEQELALVLIAHPKADVFMMAAFESVHAIMVLLQFLLSAQHSDSSIVKCPTDENVVTFVCQQCEASLQFLHSLCLQKIFRDRLLRNKELCGKGVLYLVQCVLKLNIMPPFNESLTIAASVSRLKAKALSMFLHLCESESISYLDDIAASQGTLDLAKSIALEVLNLLKTGLIIDPNLVGSGPSRTYPVGLLQLNALRLADIFSDDSNFRSFVTDNFTEFLSATCSLSHEDFVVTWCSSDYPTREEDVTLDYDTFAAIGWVLDAVSSPQVSNVTKVEFSFIQNGLRQASYAHQRSAQFVKIVANLHCFVPNICEEQERNFFLNKFLECLHMDPSKVLPGFSFVSGTPKAAIVCRNLRSLLSHADALVPVVLNEDDIELLRVFCQQLELLINPAAFEDSRVQEAQSRRGSPSPSQRNEHLNPTSATGNNPREEMSESSAFQEDDSTRLSTREDADQPCVFGASQGVVRDVQVFASNALDTSNLGGRNAVDQQAENDGSLNPTEKIEEGGRVRGVAQEEEKVGTVAGEEKQQRKRKRTIMNENQIAIMERALLDEPDMQRNTDSIRSWAEKLTLHGSEVTPSQLRNWLNNRKARLARAHKEGRTPSEAEKHRQVRESSDSPSEDRVPFNTRGNRTTSRSATTSDNINPELGDTGSADATKFKPCQHVMLLGAQGEEIGKGKVHQVVGKWYENSLEESHTYVVDVSELKGDRWARLPYPSDATGLTFGEAEARLGVMRVLWDTSKVLGLPAQ